MISRVDNFLLIKLNIFVVTTHRVCNCVHHLEHLKLQDINLQHNKTTKHVTATAHTLVTNYILIITS